MHEIILWLALTQTVLATHELNAHLPNSSIADMNLELATAYRKSIEKELDIYGWSGQYAEDGIGFYGGGWNGQRALARWHEAKWRERVWYRIAWAAWVHRGSNLAARMWYADEVYNLIGAHAFMRRQWPAPIPLE